MKDKIKKYLLCFKKQKCPACGEQCISFFKKMYLGSFFSESECPNCKEKLQLKGKIFTVNWIYITLLFLFSIISFVFKLSYSSNVQVIYITIFVLINIFIVYPFARIEVYNSTPMDDLINWYGRVKKFFKNLFSKKNK